MLCLADIISEQCKRLVSGMLWGNDKTKGWETIPSSSRIPEFGGRMQIPVPESVKQQH